MPTDTDRGLDIALADLTAKRLGVPRYQQLGLDPAAAPTSSFSIGLVEPDEMRAKAEHAVDRPGTGAVGLRQ